MSNDRAVEPFDPGLQPERTALAWRRTALSLIVASALALRILPELLGPWSAVLVTAGLFVSIYVFVAAHYRLLRHHRLLTNSDSDRIALPDGRLPGLVAITVLAGGIAGAVGIFLMQ